MLVVINNRAPDLLTLFKCSEGTRVAAKLPSDAEDKCKECFFRLVYIIKWHSVPPKLVVGFDQIGVYILPSSGTTFAEHGSKQVDIVAKDEKRAYTLLVASTPEGTFLPFQQRGFDFTFAKSNKKGSHFSMLKTMKEWVENIFEPYRRSVIEIDPDLDDDQVSIIYLDCYPVHAGQEFHTYVFDGFPHIILCFMPASCK
ncbi:hypothetical protein EDD22DRAFT_981399 [Suillus occidentalis]|nr:hypothetical protein EDD22DRAFT_981399 [Suillus occidentalis]